MPVCMEICVDSLASVTAVEGYAWPGEIRYEVCSNLLSGGGLTPSFGLVRIIRKRYPGARLMVMIRPRTGSFVYSEDELLTMAADILAFKEEGIKGFVFGCLTRAGEVDVSACKRLVNAAGPLPVTFHRAFDVTLDWRRAFEAIASVKGITRVLTSGHGRTALEGAWTLSELVEASRRLATGPDKREILITAASGINGENVGILRRLIPDLQEVHLSGSSAWTPDTTFPLAKGAELGFGSGVEWRMDRDKVRKVWDVVSRWEDG